jgi:hypothetical protein
MLAGLSPQDQAHGCRGQRQGRESLVFNASRFVAALGPLFAGYLIATTGSIPMTAVAMSFVYIVGMAATRNAGPETRGQALPA